MQPLGGDDEVGGVPIGSNDPRSFQDPIDLVLPPGNANQDTWRGLGHTQG